MIISITNINICSLIYLIINNLYISFYTNKYYSLKNLLASKNFYIFIYNIIYNIIYYIFYIYF